MVTGFAYGDGFAGLTNTSLPSTLYVRGDEVTDDSLRLVPESRGNRTVRFERRADGVWNNTGIEVSQPSVGMGLDLFMSSAGRFVETLDVVSTDRAVLPQHPFDDAIGSTSAPNTPIFGPLNIRTVFFSDESSEVSGTELVFEPSSIIEILLRKVYLKTGATGATANVTLEVRRDSSTGPIYFKQELPASLMAAPNTEFVVDMKGLVQTVGGIVMALVFRSENTISLKSSATGDWFIAADIRLFRTEDILTESLVLGNDLSVAFSNDGRLARGNYKMPALVPASF